MSFVRKKLLELDIGAITSQIQSWVGINFAPKSHTHPQSDITGQSNSTGYPDYAKSEFIDYIGYGTYSNYKSLSDATKKSGWYGTSIKNDPPLIYYFRSYTDLTNYENSNLKDAYYYRRSICGADMGLIPEANAITTNNGIIINIFTINSNYQCYYALHKVKANGFISIDCIENWTAILFLNHVAIHGLYTTGSDSGMSVFIPVKANDELCIAFREEGSGRKWDKTIFTAINANSNRPLFHSYFIPLLQ